jgi:hypothetical protein
LAPAEVVAVVGSAVTTFSVWLALTSAFWVCWLSTELCWKV